MSDNTTNEFDKIISRLSKSGAYLDFCEEVYGYRLPLFNMTDRAQLDYILSDIPISQGDTVLDIGCGSGSILNAVVKKCGCHGIGIDKLNGDAVSLGGAEYLQGDVDDMDIARFHPTVTLLVDSIYFVKNPEKLLKDLCSISGNRIYLFFSQYLFDDSTDKRSLLGDSTMAAEILKKLDIPYSFVDYSENERKLYEKSLTALEKLREKFISEDNGDLLNEKKYEQLLGKKLYDTGRASRYLYCFSGK